MESYGIVGILAFVVILGSLVIYGMDTDYVFSKLTSGESKKQIMEQKLVKLVEQAKDPNMDEQTYAELEQVINEYFGSSEHLTDCEYLFKELGRITEKAKAGDRSDELAEEASLILYQYTNELFCPKYYEP